MAPRTNPARTRRPHRRKLLARVALGVLVALAAMPGPAPRPAAAAPNQMLPWRCDSATDVMVVVNYQELGGGIVVGCATDDPRDGFEALRQAGFRVDTTVRFPGFLCRIDGKPANDPCHTASPADAYWSYWLAPRGGRWCYANFGAGNRPVVPGTVEGWSFSKDRTAAQTPPPSSSPPPKGSGPAPAIPASDCTTPTEGAEPTTTTTRPAPTTTRPSTTRPGSTRPGSGGSTGSGPGDAPAGTRPPRPKPAEGAADPTTPRSTASDDPDADDTIEDVDPAAGSDHDDDAPDAGGSDDADDPGADDGDAGSGAAGEDGRGRAAAAPEVRIRDRSEIDDRTSSGSPWGLILTGAVVIAVAAGIAIRRRTAPPAP